MHHSLLTTKEHLDGFQFLVIMDKAAINIHIRVFFFFFFLGQKCLFPGYQARRLLHHMVTLAETIKLFVKMAISFCIRTRSVIRFSVALYRFPTTWYCQF